MGTKFFAAKGTGPRFQQSGQNLEARAIGAPAFAAGRSASAAAKDIGAAQALTKAMRANPTARSAAYPKGPKV